MQEIRRDASEFRRTDRRRSRRRAGGHIRSAAVLFITAALLSCFCCIGSFRSMAQERSSHPVTRYYTCIQLEEGDSLWSIADRYSEGSGMSRAEYVNELRRMNSIAGTKVHAGHMLTRVFDTSNLWKAHQGLIFCANFKIMYCVYAYI